MNQLTYEYNDQKYIIPLSIKPVSIGRSDEADYTLPTKLASRIHVQIICRDGSYWLEDLGSANGTGLNGKVLENITQLNTGDVIKIGDIQMVFYGETALPKGPPDKLIARILFQPSKKSPAKEVLVRNRITVGRKPSNDLQINSKAVSSHHLEIENRNGLYVLRDLASSNGTTVNGQQTKEVTLRNGDQIQLGKQDMLHFIDPVASTPAPPPPVQQPDAASRPPALRPAAPTSAKRPVSGRHLAAENAAHKGVYSAVENEPEASNPIPFLVIGLVVAGLLLTLGFFGGQFIKDARQIEKASDETQKFIEALPDNSMSFEGTIDKSGNPKDWTVSFEADGEASAELLADDSVKHDGQRSLRISLDNLSTSHSMLVLTTAQAKETKLGGMFSASLQLRGEGVSSLAIGFSIVDSKDQVETLGITSVYDVSATKFKEVLMTGVILQTLPESAKLRLVISGRFSRLWIDRFDVQSTGDKPPITPLRKVSLARLDTSIDALHPAAINLRTDEASIRFLPRLVNSQDGALSRPDMWSIESIKADGAVFRSLSTSGGTTRDVLFSARQFKNAYYPEPGIRLDWKLLQSKGATLSIEIKLPIETSRIIAVSDRFGTPLFVDRDSLHAYSYATVSEVMVDGTDISISFPEGAVVWFDFSHANELNLTVRSAVLTKRNSMSIVVNSQPLMFARQYQMLLDEAKKLKNVANYSASEVRARFLTDSELPGKDAGIITRAQDILDDIALHRANLLDDIGDAWKLALAQRNLRNINDSERQVLQYMQEFRADTKTIQIMKDRLKQLRQWAKELKSAARKPDEMKAAELQARGLFNDAVARKESGDVLVALLLLDNVIRSFSDTSVYPEAKSMQESINKALQDPISRDKAIDAELARIDEDIKYEDYELARNKVYGLFRKFPDTTRNRDMMKRLRQIESAFED